MRINFPGRIKRLAAARAGFRCSHSDCDRTTIGPGPTADRSSSVGKASHIYSAAVNGPRGQGGLSADDLCSIRNCIWLCSVHADLVDTHRGEQYPASVLLGYRDLHESRIARELGNLPQMKGWVDRFTVDCSPLFAPATTLSLGKATVFRGPNGTGKTAVCEWMAAALSAGQVERWKPMPKLLRTTLHVFGQQSAHDVMFEMDTGAITFTVDGEESPYNPLDFEFILVGGRHDRDGGSAIHRVACQLGLNDDAAIGLLKLLRRNPEPFVLAASWVRNQLILDVEGCRPQLPYDCLGNAEQQRVVIECAISRAIVEAKYRPTVLCLDCGFGQFTARHIESLMRKLSSPELPFQTIAVLVDSRTADTTGWQVYDFSPGVPGTIASAYS